MNYCRLQSAYQTGRSTETALVNYCRLQSAYETVRSTETALVNYCRLQSAYQTDRSMETALVNYCRLQSAYQTGQSMKTALVKIVNEILEHIDKDSVVALVSLDISAAFDMVNHNLLLDRLNKEFGIIGASNNWIGSYLSARQFFVRVSPSSSNMCPSSAGVP